MSAMTEIEKNYVLSVVGSSFRPKKKWQNTINFCSTYETSERNLKETLNN